MQTSETATVGRGHQSTYGQSRVLRGCCCSGPRRSRVTAATVRVVGAAGTSVRAQSSLQKGRRREAAATANMRGRRDRQYLVAGKAAKEAPASRSQQAARSSRVPHCCPRELSFPMMAPLAIHVGEREADRMGGGPDHLVSG